MPEDYTWWNQDARTGIDWAKEAEARQRAWRAEGWADIRTFLIVLAVVAVAVAAWWPR